MATTITQFILYFFLYSILGWACESVWCSVGERKLVNRGFLSGPYCPVYGFGALIILAVCVPVKAYPPLVYLLAMLSASLLEYFTGWLLETLFNTRWWDYSRRRFQIKGRICLRNTLLFGLLGLFATYLMDPLAERLVHALSPRTQRIAAAALLCVFAADLLHTLFTLSGLQKRLSALHDTVMELERYNEAYAWYDRRDIPGSIHRLRAICQEDQGNAEAARILQKLDSLASRKDSASRLLKAFPASRHKTLEEELRAIRAAAQERRAARKGEEPPDAE